MRILVKIREDRYLNTRYKKAIDDIINIIGKDELE